MKQPPDLPEPIGAVCPCCKQTLDKRPKRKKKCPHCGSYIYVRSLPSGNHHKVLVTEDGAKSIDLERERVRSTKRWLKRLDERFGVSDKDFDRHRKMLRERFGQEPGDGDVLWSLFHGVLDRSMKDGNSRTLSRLYFEMARFLYEEGRDFSHLLVQSHRMELMDYRDVISWGFVERVHIATKDDRSCQACKRLQGTVLTIEEALANMPVPCKECTYELRKGSPGWCRCMYLAVLDS